MRREPENRWAAFTDAELLEIAGCMGYAEQNTRISSDPPNPTFDRIYAEIDAELTRRDGNS